jgi:SAM-dependent MidA family methyltransferase
MKDNAGVKPKPPILPTPSPSGVFAADGGANPLLAHVLAAVEQAGGWLPFDRFMVLALYAPGLGYYANDTVKLGHTPQGGSDFVTAPELSPWFGRTLGQQVAQALQATGTRQVWEFGAGTGALAEQVLTQLKAQGVAPPYTIVELSSSLRERQQARLAAWGAQVQWAHELPTQLEAVLIGNEVLDAMPVQLLHRTQGVWHERGVVCTPPSVDHPQGGLAWEDRPTSLKPPVEPEGEHDYLTEIHPQAEAFVRTLAERWQRGAAFWIDYGFGENEYYHPQRHMGTLMCHRLHQSDDNPLVDVGLKDITAHVNFTGVALAAQDAGLQVIGYTSQGRFLINAGLFELAAEATLAERANLAKLVNEHEMGELFKVLAMAPAASTEGWLPMGFVQGDRTHTL